MTLFHSPSVQAPAAWALVNFVKSAILGKLQDVGFRYTITLAEQAVGLVSANLTYGFDPGDVRRYGADPTGATASDTAFARAVSQAAQAGGAEITAPGTYLLNIGCVVTGNGTKIRAHGMGSTILKAGANGIAVLKIAASNCTVDSVLIDGNGHTSVDGLVVAPANEAITNATSQVNFNTFYNVLIQNCANGLRLRAGPTVTGVDSGCFYQTFFGCFWLNCTRSIWMQNAVNNGVGAPNRCSFHGCRGGSSSNVCNTGLQIDAGGTNQFYGLHFEGISNGATPSATPTAIVIANFAAGSGAQNINNHFFGCMLEANTLDWNNASPTTEVFGSVTFASKFAAGMTNPATMLTGDPSIAPLIIPGMQYSEGLTGYPSGYWGMSKEIADAGKQWQSYTASLSTANISNTVSITNAVANFRQLSNMVELVASFQFDASVAGTQLTITPPVAPNAAQYTSTFVNAPFYSVTVIDGSGTNKVVEAGWTSTGKLYVKAPSGGWSTSGNNNGITLQLSYHV